MDSRRNFLRGLAQAAARASRSERASEDEPAPESARPPRSPGSEPVASTPRARYADALEDPEWGPEAQAAVASASVLVLGAGALASPVAAYLAGAGVGRLGVVDGDIVELSELHKQTLHYTPDVGVPRAHSATAKLAFLNPEIVIEPYQVAVGEENAVAVLSGHDLVVDCSEDPALRQLVNATCCAEGVSLVTAEVHRHSAVLWAVLPGITACLECARVAFDPASTGSTSARSGPRIGVVGSLQASLALDVLVGRGPQPPETGLAIEFDPPRLQRISAPRRRDCAICGGLGA